MPGVGGEFAVLGERRSGEIEEPRGDHTAAPPGLSYIRESEVEPVLLRQRFIARVPQDIEALRVRLHQPVFDAVVDHLHEMSGAVRAGIEVALSGPWIASLPVRRRRDVAFPRRERTEDRIEPLYDFLLAADHQTVAALQSPNSATCANIEIVDAFSPQRLRARDVVLPERVAPVDDGVAC